MNRPQWLKECKRCGYRITHGSHDVSTRSAQTIHMEHVKYGNPLCCYGGVGKRCTYNSCHIKGVK
jgi:hypothetical protein